MRKTSWQLYTSNERAWAAMVEACEKAKESIDLEQFIFVPDDFGNKLLEVCTQKAKEGVKVRFIWDAIGSFSFFGTGIMDDLRSKGIELVFFKNLFPDFFDMPDYKSWYFRNHRRSLIIDRRMAFTGSICVYEKMKNWRDTNVRIDGPVVDDMSQAFERMWNRANNKKIVRIKGETRDSEFKYITNSPIPRHHHLYKQTLLAIREAKKSIYITNPYFVPTHRLARTIKQAAKRGVDVKIIIPKTTNYILIDLATRTFFHSMLSAGVKIFLYKNVMLHAKALIIDGNLSSVGTLNMDSVSLLYNFEANIISTNKDFAEELLKHFHEDLSKSEEMTLEEWQKGYWFQKFLGIFVRLIRDLL